MDSGAISQTLSPQQITRITQVRAPFDIQARPRFSPDALHAAQQNSKTGITYFDFAADFFRNSYKLDLEGRYCPDPEQGLSMESFQRRNSAPDQKLYLTQDEMNKICDHLKTNGLTVYLAGINYVRTLETNLKLSLQKIDSQYKTTQERTLMHQRLLAKFNQETKFVHDQTSLMLLLEAAVMKNSAFRGYQVKDLRRIADVLAIFITQLSDKAFANYIHENSTSDIELALKSLSSLARDKVSDHITNNPVIALAEEHTEFSPAHKELIKIFPQLKDSYSFGIELPPNYTKAQMLGEINPEEDAKVFQTLAQILREISSKVFATSDIQRFCSHLQDRSNIIGDLSGIPEGIKVMNQAAYDAGIEIFGFDQPEGNTKNRAIMALVQLINSDKYLADAEKTSILDYLRILQNQVLVERNSYSGDFLAKRAQSGNKGIITLSGVSHILNHEHGDESNSIPGLLSAKKIPNVSVVIDHESTDSSSKSLNYYSQVINVFSGAFSSPRMVLETHYPISRHTSLLKNNNADAYWVFPGSKS